jgi:hypothetical protein
MNKQRIGASPEQGAVPAFGAPDWLCLSAAPTFAVMAFLTAVLGGGPQDTICAAAGHALPLNGMVWMYVLMSAFHAPPWLKLVAGRRKPSVACV